MEIPNPTPTVKPASEEEIYNSLWISRVMIRSPFGETASAHIELKPYNAILGKTLGETKMVFISDLDQEASTNSKIGIAMQSLNEAVVSLLQEGGDEEAEEVEEA